MMKNESNLYILLERYIELMNEYKRSVGNEMRLREIDESYHKNDEAITREVKSIISRKMKDNDIEHGDNDLYFITESSSEGPLYFSEFNTDEAGDLDEAFFYKEKESALEVQMSRVIECIKAEALVYMKTGDKVLLQVYPAQKSDICVLKIEL